MIEKRNVTMTMTKIGRVLKQILHRKTHVGLDVDACGIKRVMGVKSASS